ncbi:MAG: Tad domain-containing protein [Myxococcota bacterium]|nr:Tad domain-containing protein [Myxococcota bacterium]
MRKVRSNRHSGSVTVYLVISMLGILGMGSLAIDIGYAYNVKIQLQNIADSAARAAVIELATQLVALDPVSQSTHLLTADETQSIKDAAQAITTQHEAGSQQIVLDPADIEIGRWDYSTSALSITSSAPNSIRVAAHRTSGTNGPIRTFLGSAVGVPEIGISASATGALTPLGGLGEGDSSIPLGISSAWFANAPDSCDQPIRFYPTGTLDGCAGWHTFDSYPASAAKLRDILDGLTDETFVSPAVAAGDSLNYTGGTVSSAFSNMEELFEARRFDETPFDEMNATVAVYEAGDCSNPNGTLAVVGFASIVITDVVGPPAKTIDGVVKCNIIEAGSGGGGEFGTSSFAVGLVD